MILADLAHDYKNLLLDAATVVNKRHNRGARLLEAGKVIL